MDLKFNRRIEPIIKATDMNNDIKYEVIRVTQEAMEKYNQDLSVAKEIKEYFEKKFKNSIWHCIIGRKFGSFVTYETGYYIYFYIGQTAFLLYKTS